MTMKARIFRSSKRNFECHLVHSKEIVSATALATLLKEDHLVVGDWVGLTPPRNENEEWRVESVEARQNAIFRNIPREQKKKVIASNVDIMLIVMSAGKPAFKRGLVDRYLVRSDFWNIPSFIIFNKMDLYDENEFDIKFEADRLNWVQAECFEVSAENPLYSPQYLKSGFMELKSLLKGKTAILLGHSGVGKSKLITSLTDGKVQLLSKELGKVGKGAHTTTWAELIDAEDFTLIDSPGVRSMSLSDLTKDELLYSFSDINEWSTRCKYASTCQHDEQSVGCFFKNLNPTSKESRLILSRLDSYQRILQEVSSTPDWRKKNKF